MYTWGQFGILMALSAAVMGIFILGFSAPVWPVIGGVAFIWIISFVIAAIMQEL